MSVTLFRLLPGNCCLILSGRVCVLQLLGHLEELLLEVDCSGSGSTGVVPALSHHLGHLTQQLDRVEEQINLTKLHTRISSCSTEGDSQSESSATKLYTTGYSGTSDKTSLQRTPSINTMLILLVFLTSEIGTTSLQGITGPIVPLVWRFHSLTDLCVYFSSYTVVAQSFTISK